MTSTIRFSRAFKCLLVTLGVVASGANAQQGLLLERWNNLPGMNLQTLRQEISLRPPNLVSTTADGSTPQNAANHYGLRLRGWLEAPVTGDYTFWVAGNDHFELWLSPDNAPFEKELLAWSRMRTSFQKWEAFPTQRSPSVHLTEGEFYYIEGLLKESVGGDHLSIGWSYTADAQFEEVVLGGAVGSWGESDGNVSFSVQSGDLSNTTDDGLFRYRNWSGEGEFITRIPALNHPDQGALAGLMIRAHGGADSRFATIYRTSDSHTGFRKRSTDGAGSAEIKGHGTAHEWLRLIRQGNTVTASFSDDRRNWFNMGSVNFASLPESILVGHMVCSKAGSGGPPLLGSFDRIRARDLAIAAVPGVNLTPYTGHPEDLDDDGLEDAWEVLSNLDPNDPYGDNGSYGDPDKDGRSNPEEYMMGTDPNVQEWIAGRLSRESWRNIGGRFVKNLTDNNGFFERSEVTVLVEGVDYINTIDRVGGGTRYRGELIAPSSGIYKFWISSGDQGELWLADGTIQPPGQTAPLRSRFGKRLVASIRGPKGQSSTSPGNFDAFASQQSGEIYLEGGNTYYFETLHKNGYGISHVSVAWQPPGQQRQVIPGSQFRSHLPSADDIDDDGLPDAWEVAAGLDPAENGRNDRKQGQLGDWDSDGLTNLQEYQFGTNPKSEDTDGDGLTDYEEIFHYKTDPLVSNVITRDVHADFSLGQYSTASGAWTEAANGSITAVDRRGGIDYTFTVQPGDEGIFEIEVTGGATGNLRPVEDLPISIRLDAITIATKTIVSHGGGSDTIRTFSPWLRAGTYTVSIFHENYRADRRLRLESVTIVKCGGADLNGNGLPDWVEASNTTDNRLTHAPTSSLVSPAVIEGVAFWKSPVISIGPDTEDVLDVRPGINDGFYANVPLEEDLPTNVEVHYPGHATGDSASIQWAASNLVSLSSTSGQLNLRKGDSLRLDAWGGSNPSGTFTVTLDGQPLADQQANLTHDSGTPFVYQFNTVGEQSLVASWNGQNYTVTLHVYEADFGAPLSVHASQVREWDLGLLSHSLVLQADDRLSWTEIVGGPASPRRFTVGTTETAQRTVVARLPDQPDGTPGAIISHGTVHGFLVAWTDLTQDAALIHVYQDGTVLMQATLIVVGLPDDIAIKLKTMFQGTQFIDGSRTLWLTSADFDSNGMARIYFESPSGNNPRMCNLLSLYFVDPSN